MIVYEQATWKTHPVHVDIASCVVCGVSGGSYTLVPHTYVCINTCTHMHTRICTHDTRTQSMHTHTQHSHTTRTQYAHTLHTHTHTHTRTCTTHATHANTHTCTIHTSTCSGTSSMWVMWVMLLSTNQYKVANVYLLHQRVGCWQLSTLALEISVRTHSVRCYTEA